MVKENAVKNYKCGKAAIIEVPGSSLLSGPLGSKLHPMFFVSMKDNDHLPETQLVNLMKYVHENGLQRVPVFL